MLSFFRRNSGAILAIVAMIALVSPAVVTLVNVARKPESSAPSVMQAKSTRPYANVQTANRAKSPTTFTVATSNCAVQFPGVTTATNRGICSVTIDRTMYPYVAGTGTSCLGIDLTWADNYKPKTGRWVVRLRGEETVFTFAPYTLDRLNTELQPGPAPIFEFRGKVKDQYGDGTVSCGMLPAQ